MLNCRTRVKDSMVFKCRGYRFFLLWIGKGRAFDNGIICSGEQTIIAPKEEYDAIMAEAQKNGAVYVTDPAQKQVLAAGSQQEECWLAMVNAGNRLVAWERLRQGNVESVPLLPRDVLEPALRYKASGIILVHNHPGGQTRPSQPDLIFTNTVRELAVNMGLRFLDHVIVTDNGCYSICQCRHL